MHVYQSSHITPLGPVGMGNQEPQFSFSGWNWQNLISSMDLELLHICKTYQKIVTVN